MRSGSLLWGGILVLLGGLFLLSNLGIITANIWGMFWPLVMILAGVWMVWGVFFRRGPASEHRSIPLEGAARARVKLSHGAGRLIVGPGAGDDLLAEGDFGGGLDLRTGRSVDILDVEMQLRPGNRGPWNWSPGELDWTINFNPHVPLALDLETGASETRLDLTELQVTSLRLQTGASSTVMRLPAAAGHTQVELHSEAASTKIYIPEGVAARIHFSGGLSTLNVDPARFPRAGEFYQSPDYDTAAQRADLRLEAGVGAIEVR